MVDKDAFTVVSEILRPETFYEPRNQKVFSAIQTLSINEHPVDIVTVTEQLKRDGNLEDVGGQMYIYDLTAHVASSAHVEYHSRILAQKFLARQLISFASLIETAAFDESNDIELVMQEAEGKLFELSQKNMQIMLPILLLIGQILILRQLLKHTQIAIKLKRNQLDGEQTKFEI